MSKFILDGNSLSFSISGKHLKKMKLEFKYSGNTEGDLLDALSKATELKERLEARLKRRLHLNVDPFNQEIYIVGASENIDLSKDMYDSLAKKVGIPEILYD